MVTLLNVGFTGSTGACNLRSSRESERLTDQTNCLQQVQRHRELELDGAAWHAHHFPGGQAQVVHRAHQGRTYGFAGGQQVCEVRGGDATRGGYDGPVGRS